MHYSAFTVLYTCNAQNARITVHLQCNAPTMHKTVDFNPEMSLTLGI